ncbi:MAG: alpha/beta hydrolase [Saprospiraceae bacterium]|nr:alpha/beta hydrolase [Saprospiraceae bacterium]
MKNISIIALLLFVFGSCTEKADISASANDFYHLEEADAFIPILVRGNTASKKILLYVQGGPGLNTMDFAEVDYPGWKEGLEKDVAIAYYDQRGTGNAQGSFSLESVTLNQYLTDIRKIIQLLRSQYPDAELYLLGHSFGGWLSYLYTIHFHEQPLIDGLVTANAPFTTDEDEIRWTFRHQFLAETAQVMIEGGTQTSYWEEVKAWTVANASIDTPEQRQQWNEFVIEGLSTFEADVHITTGAILRTVLSSSISVVPSLFNGLRLEEISNRLFEDMRSVQLIEGIDKIKVPCLLLTGQFDDIAPPQELEFYFPSINSLKKRLIILPDAGHDSYLNQAEMFRQEITDFVN